VFVWKMAIICICADKIEDVTACIQEIRRLEERITKVYCGSCICNLEVLLASEFTHVSLLTSVMWLAVGFKPTRLRCE